MFSSWKEGADMKRIIALVCVLCILFSLPSAAFAESSFWGNPEAIEQAAESVVMLTCFDSSGNTIATASGFVAFENGVIVTNYHVIEGDVAAIQAHTESGLYFDINDVLCYDVASDIAILRTNARTGLDLLEISSSSPLLKGSHVVAIGSPQGFMNTVSEGIYSGIYILDTEYLLFSASISAGSSGGALFNEDGKVIGITSATWTEGQNLNLAVPIEKVQALWESYKNGTYVEPVEPTPEATPSPKLDGQLYVKIPIDYYVMNCKSESDLLQYVNSILYNAWETGTLQRYAKEYGLTDYLVEIPLPTSNKDKPSKDLTPIRIKGVLVIGVLPREKFAFKDATGNWQGFDISLATYIAEEIGVQLEIVETNKAREYKELLDGKFDILIGGCLVSSTVRENTKTVPYIASNNGVDETKKVYSSISEFYKDLDLKSNYNEGIKLINTYLSDTKYYNTAVQRLKQNIYQRAVKAYNEKEYAAAKRHFTALDGYKDAKKYLVLLTAIDRTEWGEWWEKGDKTAYSNLLEILSFSNAKQVMIRCYPEHFLKGTWKTASEKYYFKLKKKSDGSLQASYSLPYKDLSNSYFSFEDGIYQLSNNSKSKDVFKFTIVNDHTIKVYCYKNGKTYTMYRQ